MIRRNAMKAMGAVALGLALSVSGAAEAQQRQKFTWWYGLTGQLAEVMENYCKNFNASQTEFEIVCTGQGTYDQALQNTIAAFRANQQPTMVQVYDVGTVELMLSGQYIPVRELMKNNGYDINWADYVPSIGNYYATREGEMLSFPFNSSSAVMYWNKGAYREVGFENPPQTWEEIEKAARALKAKGSSCPIAIDFDSWQHFEQFNAIHNLQTATKDNGFGGLDTALVVNPLFRQHANNLYKWYKEGLIQLRTPQNGGLVPAFASGECGMMMGSIANHVGVGRTAKPGLEWTVGMLPLYAGHQRTNSMVGGASLWVLKGRPAAEYKGAAAFLNFIGQPAQQVFMVQNTGYIPVTLSGAKAIEESGFYRDPKNAGREVVMRSLTFTAPTGNSRGIRVGNFTQIRALYATQMQAAFSGQQTMDQALDGFVSEGNKLIRRFEQTYRGKQLP